MSSSDVNQQNFESGSGNFEIDNKDLLASLNSQLKLNYFPSDQTKHIDYVIYYMEKSIEGDENSRSNKNIKKRKVIRYRYLDQLKSKEGFEIERIVKMEENNETSNYLLLSCSFKRLMQEAERINLVLPLKTLEESDNNEKKSCQCCVNVAPDEYNYSSAPFEEDIKFVFRDFEIENNKCRGFSDSMRSFLVDNILNNMMFDPQNENEDNDDDMSKQLTKLVTNKVNNSDLVSKVRESLKEKYLITGSEFEESKSVYPGLPYMLEKEYFNEAFILHEESNSTKEFNTVLQKLIQETPDDQIDRAELLEYLNESKKAEEDIHANDPRSKLTKTWSGIKNMLKLQPLWDIRDYLGEYVAFYYAFCGVLITSLWLPSLAGLAVIIWGSINVVSTLKTNSTASASDLTTYYLNIFEDLNDTYLLLPFSFIILFWGICTTSYWNRKQEEYAYEWDTKNYETLELDRVQYSKKLQEYRIRKNDLHAEFSRSDVYCKKFMTFLILLLMIGIVAVEIAAVVVYRYYTASLFPNDSTLVLVVSTVGSSVLGAIFLVIMGQIYLRVAVCSTEWENPRTQTEFNDNLILKIFAFEFVNNYGPIYYVAFVRLFSFPTGYFGTSYSDTCSSNCMRQVTLNVFINLLVTPLSRLFSVVIVPAIKNAYAKHKIYQELKNSKSQVPIVSLTNTVKPGQLNLNQFREYAFVSTEQKKADYESSFSNEPAKANIRFEYLEKITLYGYLILFGATLSISPFIFLMILLFDIRIDANSTLWSFRRPVAKRAEDIGTYQGILTFLNIAGIVTNSFLIAFTSSYYKSFFSNTLSLQFLFVILYEHGYFIFWLLIATIPLKSSFELHRLLKEHKYVNELVLTAKETVIKSKFTTNNAVVDQVASSNYNNVVLPDPHVRQRGNGSGYEMNYDNVQPRDKFIPNNNRIYPAM